MNDLQNRVDVEALVDTFYGSVREDDLIGPIFNDVMAIDWDEHLPIMYSFWATLLLGENSYRGNPLAKHVEVDRFKLLSSEHFDRWISLWESAVNKLFAGSKAEEAKMKANRVRQMMLPKIEEIRSHTNSYPND